MLHLPSRIENYFRITYTTGFTKTFQNDDSNFGYIMKTLLPLSIFDHVYISANHSLVQVYQNLDPIIEKIRITNLDYHPDVYEDEFLIFDFLKSHADVHKILFMRCRKIFSELIRDPNANFTKYLPNEVGFNQLDIVVPDMDILRNFFYTRIDIDRKYYIHGLKHKDEFLKKYLKVRSCIKRVI